MTRTQENVQMSLSIPASRDRLLLKSFTAEESLSDLFNIKLEAVSQNRNLAFENIIGESATISLKVNEWQPRFLNGIVTRFSQGGSDGRFSTYFAELRPWLWLLTRSSDSRMFQQQSVPQILQSIFSDHGFLDYRSSLTGTYEVRDYTVQYQETAFEFVSRLMEEEGIFYFFEHEAGKHTLVIADDAAAHKPSPGLSGPVQVQPARTGQAGEGDISDCTFEQQVTAEAYAVDDFNFETPAADLLASAGAENSRLSLYEYPGGVRSQDAAAARARVRMEGVEAVKTRLRGKAIVPLFTAGHTFELAGHERTAANAGYVLKRVRHRATGSSYSNTFAAIPSATPFRPPRVTSKPLIPGAQTAIVVGPDGEEIWTDEYGRVKVQFHWDRRGQNDENSSCWIRVAQGWAGESWGILFIPRIGQEVIVTFVEGDPDRPLITGSVYNYDQRPPYTLPGEKTKSTIRSSSSNGGGGFNEIRFEDKQGAEEIYIHAQKDLNVQILDDERRSVLGSRALTIRGNESHRNRGGFAQEVGGNYVLKIDGNLTIDVSGSATIKEGGRPRRLRPDSAGE